MIDLYDVEDVPLGILTAQQFVSGEIRRKNKGKTHSTAFDAIVGVGERPISLFPSDGLLVTHKDLVW